VRDRRHLPAFGVLASAYAAGTVPVANLAARWLRGVDLRSVGTGTVSGSALYSVAGFGPLAVVGCVELAKGALGPALAGSDRPLLGAAAAAAGIVGHNWSPWLGFRGGRGVSLVLGASLVLAPEGLALTAAGLALGRLARQTGAGTFLALVAYPVVLAARRGWRGLVAGTVVVAPVLLKRVLGNDASVPTSWSARLARLVGDRDPAGTV
jgi:glycerol-3-phosphate acyltransferase PlsY